MPREDSTGGKQKLGPISKQGDQYLRRILVVGAYAVLKQARQQPEKYPWLTRLLARRTVQGRCGGACQQDGTRRLGVAGQGRDLSGACDLRQRPDKELGDGRMRLRLCVHELQG